MSETPAADETPAATKAESVGAGTFDVPPPEDTAAADDDGDNVKKDLDDGNDKSSESHVHRLHSEKTSGMETSVLKFKHINFIVGKKGQEKNILQDVSGVVKFGRVLAIMGPSGAGKTTLISALTLNAQYGVATGSVKLNGKPLDAEIFKEHCFVVQQQDKHWPYLTCRETLKYATELYDVVDKSEEDALVNEIIQKMGLAICEDTACARLSGGQRRRLSIGIALVKQPRVLFLDEPTSGLDAASAENIMQEIVRVAKDERLITICTIHQPSTKVYNNFDQVMIMSRGRIAYMGDVNEALTYFEETGHAMPGDTNPAEFFLDLVNSDFSDEAFVSNILDTWEEKGGNVHSSHHSDIDDEDEEGVVNLEKKKIWPEVKIMFRRHFTLIVRDPVVYVGRTIIMLFSCIIFALVYLKARKDEQSQAINKFWLATWLIAIPAQFGCVAVFGLNDEFKSLMSETKNGLVSGGSYVFAKSLLVLPIMIIFAIAALGIPFFVIAGAPGSCFALCMVLYACCIYVYESVAEALSVWFDDVILGMLQFMNFWFAAFLFGGFLIPKRDLYWPFELFYYLWPYQYFLRSFTYQYFTELTFDSCDRATNPDQAVCTSETSGKAVLGELSLVLPLLSTDDSTGTDIIILVAIGTFYKILYVVGVLYRTSQYSKFVHE